MCTVIGVGVLVVSLVSHSGIHLTGPQLLFTGASVWLTNVIAFGLAYWELDLRRGGGPRVAGDRAGPEFQFPQDENPSAGAGRLVVRGCGTTSTCHSPTRSRSARPSTMPLTRPAKALMAAGIQALSHDHSCSSPRAL